MAAPRTPVTQEQLDKGNVFLSLFGNVQKLEESNTQVCYKALYIPTGQEFGLTAVDVRKQTNAELDQMIQKQTTLQKTQHPHVVRHVTHFCTRKYHLHGDNLQQVSETGEVECLWVQTELLQNILESRRKNGNLKDDHVLSIVDQISRTLEHCHNMKLVHGSIKDSAVLCDENGGRVFKLGRFDPFETATSPAEDMRDLGKMLRAVSADTSVYQDFVAVIEGLEKGQYSCVADLRSSEEFRVLFSHSGFSDDCLPGMIAIFRDVMQDHLIPTQLMTKMNMFLELRVKRETIEAEQTPEKQRRMFLSALEESSEKGRLQDFLQALKGTGCRQLYKLLTGQLFKEQYSENEEVFKSHRLRLEERIDSTDLVSYLEDLGCLHRIDIEGIQSKHGQKGQFEGMKLLLDRVFQKNPLTSSNDILEAVYQVDPGVVLSLDPNFKPKQQEGATRSRATAGPSVRQGSSPNQSRSETPASSSQASASNVRSSSSRSVPAGSSSSSLAGSSTSEKDSVTKQDCLRVLKENGGWMTAKDIAKKLGFSGGRSTVNPRLNDLVIDGTVEKSKDSPPLYRNKVDNQ